MKIVLTAAYDRSLPAVAVCELLRRGGHQIMAVLVTAPFSLGRIRRFYRQQGLAGILTGFRKLRGRGSPEPGPLDQMLDEEGIADRSLKSWCRNQGADRIMVNSHNSARALACLRARQPQAVVYAGGGILGEAFIQAAGGRVINPHSGPLPQIRGMNAIEWALLLNAPLEATVHLIDKGIDSGPILGRFKVNPEGTESVPVLRERAVVAGVRGLASLLEGVVDLDDLSKEANIPPPDYRQCFTMAPALQALVAAKLAGLNHG